MEDDSTAPRKRQRISKRTACDRCQRRKQACDAASPSCSNCYKAGVECLKPFTHSDSPAITSSDSRGINSLATFHDGFSPGAAKTQTSIRPQDSGEQAQSYIADVVGFLSLGGGQSYVGSSSGYALAVDLDSVVQATVWNKIRPCSLDSAHTITLADFERDGTGPPDADMGNRILDAYLNRLVSKYSDLVEGILD